MGGGGGRRGRGGWDGERSLLSLFVVVFFPFFWGVQVIQKQPPRQKSLDNIAALEEKLQTLMANRDDLKQKLELRKKQFHLLVHCVHQLQDMLEHQEDVEEEDSTTVVSMDVS